MGSHGGGESGNCASGTTCHEEQVQSTAAPRTESDESSDHLPNSAVCPGAQKIQYTVYRGSHFLNARKSRSSPRRAQLYSKPTEREFNLSSPGEFELPTKRPIF